MIAYWVEFPVVYPDSLLPNMRHVVSVGAVRRMLTFVVLFFDISTLDDMIFVTIPDSKLNKPGGGAKSGFDELEPELPDK
jgi:hypothetical protein